MFANKGLWGRLALFTAALIWGTSFVVLKSALGDVGTMWTLAIRFSLAAVLMLIPAGRKLKKMDRRSFKGAVLMGFCLAAAYIVQTYGLVFTSPGKNAFLTSTYCVLVPFMAWGIYKRKPSVFNICAAVLCVTGIGLVALNSGFDEINIGDILTLMCGIFYSLQIIMMEQYIGGCDSLSITGVQFSAAAVVCWHVRVDEYSLSQRNVYRRLLFPSGLGHALYPQRHGSNAADFGGSLRCAYFGAFLRGSADSESVYRLCSHLRGSRGLGGGRGAFCKTSEEKVLKMEGGLSIEKL